MAEVVYTNVIRTAKLAMRVLGQPIEITGLEHLPRTGPAALSTASPGSTPTSMPSTTTSRS